MRITEYKDQIVSILKKIGEVKTSPIILFAFLVLLFIQTARKNFHSKFISEGINVG